MFRKLGIFAMRFRWWIVGFWALVMLIALPFAPQASKILQSGGLISPDAESQRAVDLLTEKLHLHLTVVQVIFDSSKYTVEDPAYQQELADALKNITNWTQVASVTTFVDNPRQVSLDRHASYVNINLKVSSDEAPKLLPEIEQRLQTQPDLTVHVGGPPVFYDDIQVVSERDLQRAELFAFPFALLALLWVFRSVVAAILPGLVGGAAVLVTLALLFGLGHVWPLSIFVLNITTLFGLGLGVDYSLFIVSRFREELAHGNSVEEAVIQAIAHAGRAVAFSGFTVTIGLLGLTIFRINMLRSIGIGGILVVSLAVLAALTFLPAMLGILGKRIDVFSIRKKVRDTGEHQGFWYRFSQFVMRYPVRIFVPVFLILLSLGLPFLGVHFSAPDASILPKDVPSRNEYDILASRFDIRETTPIVLAVETSGPALTQDNIRNLYYYMKRIDADSRVSRVDSVVSADPRLTLDQYLAIYAHPEEVSDPYLRTFVQSTVADNLVLVQVFSKYEMGATQSLELAQTLRNTDPGSGMHVLVSGNSAANIDYVNSLYEDFPLAVLLIFLITYIVLFILFRSLILPLKAIFMNTLSIMASYGALVVIFQNGWLHQILGFQPLGFVEASSPILLFCALFGLSMDYEVFLLARIQEAYEKTGDNTLAVAQGLERSGGIITSAAVIVVVVSACFATADMILVKALGVGMAIAVTLDATLVRGLLVPSTMRLLGRWNWWIPFVKRKPVAVPTETSEVEE